MTLITPADLTAIERTYLGVVATGIVPGSLAKDDTFRADYLTAVCLAIQEGKPRDSYLEQGGPAVSAAFHQALNAAAHALDARGIISAGTPAPVEVLSLDPDVVRPPAPHMIDFDQAPRLFDRRLAQECMETLFQDRAVYPFLMGRYQDSGEIWGRLYKDGYGRWR